MTMITITKRFKFKCWQCQEVYSIFKEVQLDPEKEKGQKIKVSCPFCGVKAVADFAPHLNRKKVVLRDSTRKNEAEFSYKYQLPDILPTKKPEIDD